MDLDARRRLAARAVVGLTVVAIAALLVHGPVPQDEGYHAFADRRAWLGVPNALDVLSNAPFLAVGLAGLRVARRGAERRPRWATTAATLFAVGVAATAVGSALYHLAPRDATLVLDRLPMGLAFGAFFALLLGDRLGPRAGRAILGPAVVLGPASVLLWWASRSWTPGGDLRLYGVAQFLPAVSGVLLLALVPPTDRAARAALWAGLLGYAAAKALEAADEALWRASGGLLAGHALKHVAAAVAAGFLVRWVARTDAAGEAAATA